MCQLTREVAVSESPRCDPRSADARERYSIGGEAGERERENTRAGRSDPRRSVRELSVKLVKFNFGFSTSGPEGPVGRNGAGNDKWRGARTQITRTRGPLPGIKSFF